MERVMIVGGPGSGKSWLAAALSTQTGLPVISIDDFVHGPDGKVRAADRIDADSMTAADGTKWIIEGGNSRTYAYRAARADTLIRLAPPLWLRFWRVWRRDGLNLALLTWTLKYDRRFGPRDQAVVESAAGDAVVLHLRSKKDVGKFLTTNAHPAFPLRP